PRRSHREEGRLPQDRGRSARDRQRPPPPSPPRGRAGEGGAGTLRRVGLEGIYRAREVAALRGPLRAIRGKGDRHVGGPAGGRGSARLGARRREEIARADFLSSSLGRPPRPLGLDEVELAPAAGAGGVLAT